jgi:hypothetical protein
MRAVLLAALPWATTAGVPPVEVSVRPGAAPGLECTLRDVPPAAAAARLGPSAPGRWRWQRAPGDVLACSAPGFEPVDLAGATLGAARAATVDLVPGRPVTLHPPAGTTLHASVEWRALRAGATSLLARRALAVSGPTAVFVAAQDRVLRVTAAGSSPVSFLLPAGAEAARIDVPAPQRGGEVWGVLPPHRYRPETVSLQGGGHHRALRPGPGGAFQASGLAPGSYTLVPAYRGGHAGRALAVVVRAGETAEVWRAAASEPGAVRVSLAAPLCGEGPLDLELAPEGGGGPSSRRPLPGSACDLEVEGLEEGTWRVAVLEGGGRNEERARAAVAVAAGASAAVMLEPVVRVSGRVTFGGRPAPRLRVAFTRGPRQWNVETDADGAYAAVLGEPGEYGVSLQASAELPSRAMVRALRAGDQHQDFELGEGALLVRVRGAEGDLAGGVELALLASNGPRLTGWLRPEQQEEARFVGLDFGEYAVTGSTPTGLTTRAPAQVVLSAGAPEAEVVLVLGRHQGRLALIDPQGRPIAGARVQAGRAPLAETSPGVFVLDAVAVGERLTVNAPGHTPLCRVLQSGDLPELRLTPPPLGGTLTLRFAGDVPWQEAAILGLPGSDCPVALHEVEAQVTLEPQGATLVLQLPRGTFAVAVGSRAEQVAVPGPEVTIAR